MSSERSAPGESLRRLARGLGFLGRMYCEMLGLEGERRNETRRDGRGK